MLPPWHLYSFSFHSWTLSSRLGCIGVIGNAVNWNWLQQTLLLRLHEKAHWLVLFVVVTIAQIVGRYSECLGEGLSVVNPWDSCCLAHSCARWLQEAWSFRPARTASVSAQAFDFGFSFHLKLPFTPRSLSVPLAK